MTNPVCQRCGGDEIDRGSCVCPKDGEVVTGPVPPEKVLDLIVAELRSRDMHDAVDVVRALREKYGEKWPR